MDLIERRHPARRRGAILQLTLAEPDGDDDLRGVIGLKGPPVGNLGPIHGDQKSDGFQRASSLDGSVQQLLAQPRQLVDRHHASRNLLGQRHEEALPPIPGEKEVVGQVELAAHGQKLQPQPMDDSS